MSKYYGNYSQYLGARRCCDLRVQGPEGPPGPTGPQGISGTSTGTGATGPTGPSVNPTSSYCYIQLPINQVLNSSTSPYTPLNLGQISNSGDFIVLTNKITINNPGTYFVSFSLYIEPVAINLSVTFGVRLNDSINPAFSIMNIVQNNQYNSGSVSGIFQTSTSTDFLECIAVQSAGSGLIVKSGFCSIFRLT